MKVWKKPEIMIMLQDRDRAVERGIVAIYNKQTESEQDTESTREHNGVGYNGTDAAFMSSLAKQLLSGRTLSQKQLEAGRRCLMKYAGQLTKIANGEI
jgi:hypothetical protein